MACEHEYSAPVVGWDEDDQGNGWRCWTRFCLRCRHLQTQGCYVSPAPDRDLPPPAPGEWTTDYICGGVYGCDECKARRASSSMRER